MIETKTLSLRQVAFVNFVQKLARLAFWLSLLAVACIALHVAGMFAYESLYPPAPLPGIQAIFGSTRRAPFLLMRSYGWVGGILYLLAAVKLAAGITLSWAGKPCYKPLLLGTILMTVAAVLSLLTAFSCGC